MTSTPSPTDRPGRRSVSTPTLAVAGGLGGLVLGLTGIASAATPELTPPAASSPSAEAPGGSALPDGGAGRDCPEEDGAAGGAAGGGSTGSTSEESVDSTAV